MEQEVQLQSDFKNRKTRLLVMGVLQILLGSFLALMVPMMLLGGIVSRISQTQPEPAMTVGSLIAGALFYVVLAVWFITMGIGSLKARRWARALILITSWLWLICGIITSVIMLFLLPGMSQMFAGIENIPEGAEITIVVIMMIFLGLIYILMPGLLVLLYSGRHVKMTCEYLNPEPDWTDQCPLPVLGMCLVLLLGVFSVPSMGSANWVLPFFGVVLSGIWGAVAIVLGALLLLFATWQLYQLDIKGWWLTLLLMAGWGISAFVTFSMISTESYFQAAGYDEAQMESLELVQFMSTEVMRWGIAAWVLIAIAYLIFILRYFKSRPNSLQQFVEN